MDQRTSQNRESMMGCGVLSHGGGRGRGLTRVVSVAALLLLGAMSVAAGCSGDDTSTAGTPTAGTGGAGGSGGSGGGGGSGGLVDMDATTECAIRPGIDTYTANLMKKGKRGVYSFLLVSSDPGPPAQGNNNWKLKVTGSDGMPISSGLTVTVKMPDHGHNSPVPAKIMYDAAGGTFSVNPVYLSMPGMWVITFTVMDPNEPTTSLDSAEFTFCAP